MDFVDGFVAAVPLANKAEYLRHAAMAAAVFRDHGATRVVECWGEDVPDGVLTSFPLAVKAGPGEAVVFAWIAWPSRAVRDDGMAKAMADPRFINDGTPMPFDGKRMIFGGFQMVLDA